MTTCIRIHSLWTATWLFVVSCALALGTFAGVRAQSGEDVGLVVKNLGAEVNSMASEGRPVLAPDGVTLYFTSDRAWPATVPMQARGRSSACPPMQTFVRAAYTEHGGKEPVPLVLSNGANDFSVVSVSTDGEILFVIQHNGKDMDLFQCRRTGEQWGQPASLAGDINSKANETGGVLSADGRTFYFVSDRKGGLGQKDIYRVTQLPNGQWSAASPLGGLINTTGNEADVSIHPNGRILYFSSQGHGAIGGYDLFSTEILEDGTFTPPLNLGPTVNTRFNERSLMFNTQGTKGFFASDRPGGSGAEDIYVMNTPIQNAYHGLTVLKGYIVAPPGEALPSSTVLIVTEQNTGLVWRYTPRQRDGVYVAILPNCAAYNLDYRVEDRTIHTEDIFVDCETSYQEINREIYLNPVSLSGPASVGELPKGSPPGSKEKPDKTIEGEGRSAQLEALERQLQNALRTLKAERVTATIDEVALANTVQTLSDISTTAAVLPGHLIYYCPNELREEQTGDLVVTLGELLADSALQHRVLTVVNEAQRAMGEDEVDVTALRRKEVDLSRIMTVTVDDPGANFQILQVHLQKEQEVLPGVKNEWHWKITPKKGTAGTTIQLIVKVSGRNAAGDETLQESTPFGIQVSVKLGFLRSAWLLFQTDPKWAFGSFLIPLFLYFFGRWTKGRERKGASKGERT